MRQRGSAEALILVVIMGASVLAAFFIIKNITPAAISPAPAATGTLRAKFIIGPLQPVCREGQNCSGPYANKPIEVYRKVSAAVDRKREGSESSIYAVEVTPMGSVLVATLNTDANGLLTISLPPDDYYLMTKEGLGIEKKQRQISFTILGGQTTEAEVQIDTGIR